MERVDARFTSGGLQCAAWLYQPEGIRKPRPLIIMGPGLGATKDMGLDPYARRFAAAGMGVLAFDYRHFGESAGTPRQVLRIARQRADWHAAIAYARTLRGFDATRIALWGSSFSAGQVLSVAPEDAYIAAVVAQAPILSGWAAARARGPISLAKVAALAATDMTVGPILRRPIRVRLAGDRRAAALMAAPGADSGLARLAEQSTTYHPKIAARAAFSTLWDNPGRRVKDLKMPVLFALCEQDRVAPLLSALRAAERTRHALVKRYPAQHFDIYFDAVFEQAVRDQTDFFTSVLRP